MSQGMGFRIQSLWAYLAVHADNDEGVIATLGPSGVWIPMIGADQARLRSLEPVVREMVAQSKMPVVLAQFAQRTDLETIG